VKGFTAREIERLLLGSEFGDYRVARLEDVFHRYGPALRYVVEVKVSPSTQMPLMARRIASLAAQYGVARRCLVASFDAEFLRKMREVDPAIATSFLFDHPIALPEPGRLTPLFPPVDGIGPRRDLVTPALVAQARAARLGVHPWTVDETLEMERLFRAGVDSLTTNAPDVARQLRDSAPEPEKGLAVV
jgi:glycerophosphoryl diester phosphodiesterase